LRASAWCFSLKVEDYYIQKRRGWIRLHEKGGKVNEIPCHHNLEKYLEEYLAAAGIGADADGPLFRASQKGKLQRNGLNQSNVHKMIRRALPPGRHPDQNRLP
jgi:integrase/recombinase XerD